MELPFYFRCNRKSLEREEHGSNKVDVSRDHDAGRGAEEENSKSIVTFQARNHAVLDEMLRGRWTAFGYVRHWGLQNSSCVELGPGATYETGEARRNWFTNANTSWGGHMN